MPESTHDPRGMEILILTGMSGSGKSKAADYLEDMGFFCVDNLPPTMLFDLIETFARGKGHEQLAGLRLAFVIDVRAVDFFVGIPDSLALLNQKGIPFRLIYLDCADTELISRYKQSRRNHPLAGDHGIMEGLQKERDSLAPLRDAADVVIDTTEFSLSDLRERMADLMDDPKDRRDPRLSVLIQSFGFKYGVPADADLVLDVRFIPNPFYIPELRPQSGQDRKVRSFVLDQPETTAYLNMQLDLLKFTLPLYVREGKVRLSLAIGCTGGRHRSVAVADELAKRLRQLDLYPVVVAHRDILLDDPMQGADESEDTP